MRRRWIALGVAAAAVVGCGSARPQPRPQMGVQRSCHQEVTQADVSPSSPIRPHPATDLVIGPLSFPQGRELADITPRDFLATGRLGSYKLPPVLAPGVTVTIAIASPARRYVTMDIPEAPPHVVLATYHGCPHAWGFFPQGFAFSHHRVRGCVPLTITVRGQRPRRVVLSLFAGKCRDPRLFS